LAGVGIIQGATEFFLPKTKEKAALAALKSARASYVDVQAGKSLTLGLAAIGWLVHRDDEGNIDGHPKFGAGLVTAMLDRGRIQVAFADRVRALVHNRSGTA
jgi:hypothetical protein